MKRRQSRGGVRIAETLGGLVITLGNGATSERPGFVARVHQKAPLRGGVGGYDPLRRHGYKHPVTFLQGQAKSPSQLMPHVHQVVSLLKRWLLGAHHGAVIHEHLDSYLDEFTFRFNRRRSRSRGKLFFASFSRPWPLRLPVRIVGEVRPS